MLPYTIFVHRPTTIILVGCSPVPNRRKRERFLVRVIERLGPKRARRNTEEDDVYTDVIKIRVTSRSDVKNDSPPERRRIKNSQFR